MVKDTIRRPPERALHGQVVAVLPELTVGSLTAFGALRASSRIKAAPAERIS